MTSLEQIMRTALLAQPSLTALIGQRLYDVMLPAPPTYPCVRFQRISTVPYSTMNQSANWQGMGWARFQFDIWANGSNADTQTDTICRTIQAAMLTFNASTTPTSPEVINQAPNFMLNRSLTVQPQTNPPLFWARMDWRILYQEQ